MVIPYLGTEKWIQSLDLTVESNWAPWFVEYEVAGLVPRSHLNCYFEQF